MTTTKTFLIETSTTYRVEATSEQHAFLAVREGFAEVVNHDSWVAATSDD